MPDDVSLAKAAIIEHCLKRVLKLYEEDPGLDNLLYLDALTLNVERACQAAIDLALHVVASNRLGLPENQAGGFRLLYESGKIERGLSERMIAICGFPWPCKSGAAGRSFSVTRPLWFSYCVYGDEVPPCQSP